ncbi:uncharacterized protein C7orf57 homolog [Littorina saxatilis]|uniref:Uncharacterized protein n=1 Tax=Littorina saxatilis TaxID=31220 RepID=A0AAN9BWS4_9CAEN
MNQKPNETGWFYHAPAKRTEGTEPVGVPPASQIPGLGDVEVLEPDTPKEMVFRDTDTKYIRMAKMGGRKDLLSIRQNSDKKKEPVGYPRSEWFYLEDNALEDQAQKEREQEPWQFLLPEYMVHQGRGETSVDGTTVGGPRRRVPYATEEQSQFTRDGQSMTDKTVKIPETRPPGFGIRSGKPAPRGPKMDKTKPLSSQVQGERPRLRHQPMPSEPEDETNMTKLLAGTYEKEWHERVTGWQDKQTKNRDKSQAFIHSDGPARTEYNNNYTQSSAGSNRTTRRVYSGENREAAKKEEEKKEIFKLSKFKNVPARINSHQSPDVLAAIGN